MRHRHEGTINAPVEVDQAVNGSLLICYGVRLSLVVMFPFSAADGLWYWRNSLAQSQSSGLPGGKAILIEAITPVMIVAGWRDRLAASLFAGF